MNDLEQIKQELRGDPLEEGSWGDLAKNVGSKLKNFAFGGSKNPAADLLRDKPQAMAELGKVLGVNATKMEDLLTSTKIDAATKEQIKTFFNDYDAINQIANDPSAVASQAAPGAVPPVIGGQQPTQGGTPPTILYQKIKTAAQQFSAKFIADFKKIAASLNDANLIKYTDNFSQVTLREMMANPAVGAFKHQGEPKAAKSVKKGSKSPFPSPTKGNGTSTPPSKPEATPTPPKPQLPPEFANLKKSLNDFIINIGNIAGVPSTTYKNALQGIIASNQISNEEKEKLKLFINKHNTVIKYLRGKLNKQPSTGRTPPPASKKKAPSMKAPQSATPSGSEAGDSGDYSPV